MSALRIAAPLAAVACVSGATAQQKVRTPFVAEASGEAAAQIKSFQLAPGFVCDLIAAEPDVCNAVSFAIDGKGRFWVAETFRINDGVPDTRDHMQWKDDDLACLVVADRVAKYRKHVSADLPGFEAFSERVRLLVDTNRDGSLDRSTVFAAGFNDLADGIASGVLPVDNDVFFANIPKLWRLADRDGDGVADERQVLHDGFGVHSSLIGHDLHGLIVGPDRRLWFSIGDRGFHVQQGDRTFAFPHEGAVLRCELDGSDLEVVHRGLRNPQELAFDAWGDLFTGDNNSDGGDRARLVQVVPGADSGWRIGYQWLSDRGAWNREKMWQPRHPGQPAWILPPIANFADGPSGLAYDPGVGLPDRWRGCFLLCDFRGGSGYSGVHAIRLQRSGAGFELASAEKFVWGVLATDVDFGPDGSVHVLDWVNGWSKTGKGRIYRIRTPGMANDLGARSTAALLAGDLADRDEPALRTLLAHADRRVRQRAQFALVDRQAVTTLADTAANGESRLAQVHALFGLGILGRRDPKALESVPPLLRNGDADVRAIAARVLGDARLAAAGPALVAALADGNSRVVREVALALARLGASAPAERTTKALVELLRSNDDRDVVLRHAAAYALAEVAPAEALHGLQADPALAVRRGVLLALARRRDPAIATFLAEIDESLRFEAARAIHEEPVPEAMQALAALAGDERCDSDRVDWRAVNANRLLGGVENGKSVVHAARWPGHSAATRVEALRVLADWRTPHGQDRVNGNWRPCVHEQADAVAQHFVGSIDPLLADDVTAEATAEAIGALQLAATADALVQLVGSTERPVAARLAALAALDTLRAPQLPAALARIDGAAPVALRRKAIALLSRDAPGKAVPILATLLDNAPLAEQQAAFSALGDTKDPAAEDLLSQWLQRLAENKVATGLQLDLLEAAARHDCDSITSQLAARQQELTKAGPFAEYDVCVDGGDPKEGRKVFFENEATRCTRCHTLGNQGGNAGPILDGIGKRRSRAELVEALVAPSAKIAEGFGSTTIELHDGSILVGLVTKDQDGGVTVVGTNSDAHTVPWERIKSRSATGTSAMPPMGGALTKRQLRDLIAFLLDDK